jgi:hypothetical protein
MPAREVLETASALVTGDRASAHGSIPETHENIARLWNGYMYNKDELTAHDVANMMELMKVARRKTGAFNMDDYVDGAGYAAVAYECAEAEEKNEEDVLDTFDPERFRLTEEGFRLAGDKLKEMAK